MATRTFRSTLTVLALAGLVAWVGSPATAQIYTFTSGPTGDGFNWPASPTGMLDGDYFSTPDGVSLDNYTGNQIFFDSQYQVASNSPDIDGDALWGNPNGGALDFYLDGIGGVQSISFNFANSIGGAPFNSQDYLDVEVYDSEGRGTYYSETLDNVFTGLGGFDGYSGTVYLDTSFLFDDYENLDGGQFIDIDYIYIDLYSLDNTFEPAEFAIDNFSVDGSTGNGPDELYISVNQGTDATGSIFNSNSLRGVGTHTRGIEVTNGAATDTTLSIEIEPGGDLTAGPSVVNGEFIAAGQSTFKPDIASIDRSLPTGSYESDVRLINDGDPSDPDNVSTLRVNLFEPELLSGNFASVDVNNFEDVTLSNAAAPANGFRAAVKATGGATTSGPFEVSAWAADTRLLDGDTITANVVFKRFGQLSGTHTGLHIASFEQAAYVINEFVDLEVFLDNKDESVPNQVWNLTYTHVNASTDFGNFSPGGSFNERIGVNNFDVAATLIDGTSSKNQQVSLQLSSNPDPGSSADLVGVPVDLVFSASVDDTFVLQLTYAPGSVPGGATEDDLMLLWFDTTGQEWVNAVDGNAGGTPTFFDGSYEDFLNGGTLGSGDLGTYGLDTTNDHVWAVLNHASLFAVGALSSAAAVEGDYNNSGQVEQGDLDFVLSNWGDTDISDVTGWVNFAGLPGGDIGGQVEQTELDLVLSNWGDTSAPDFGASSVPEPAAGLLVFALLGMTRRRLV